MKKITPRDVERWMGLGMEDRRTPKPFAGLYPTRWWVEMEGWNGGRRRYFRYFGKPTEGIAQQIRMFGMSNAGRLRFAEFDRGGILKRGTRALPTDSFSCTSPSPILAKLYYLRGSNEGHMFQRNSGSWRHRKRIVFAGHSILVYDSIAGNWDPATSEELRQWLSDARLVWE